jgi:putative FmdB family regulatory protein
MPIYEYRCRSCKHEFEQLLLASTTPTCPECRSQELERLLSGFAVSSASTRTSHLAAAKRRNARSSDLRDKNLAEAESHYEHMWEDTDPQFRPRPPKPSPSE